MSYKTYRPRAYYKKDNSLKHTLYLTLEEYVELGKNVRFVAGTNRYVFNADKFLKWLFTAANGFTGNQKARATGQRSLAVKLARLFLGDWQETTHFIDRSMGRHAMIYYFKRNRLNPKI